MLNSMYVMYGICYYSEHIIIYSLPEIKKKSPNEWNHQYFSYIGLLYGK